MRIVLHGRNASTFAPGFAEMIGPRHEVMRLSDALSGAGETQTFSTSDVIIGSWLNASMPKLTRLRLFQVPGAGVEGIDRNLLPDGAKLCNCFGHESAIAEYVMAALLARHVPLAAADRDLRQGRWTYWAGDPQALHTELGATTIGLLGYGHIGRAIAARAKAFDMSVTVANRSPVAASGAVDRTFPLTELKDFMGSADAIVVSLPLTQETRGIVGREALASMRPHAVIINVGRGAVIDENALYDALKDNRIGGAVIDTWYVYPSGANPKPLPSQLPFPELNNVVMTPHMSGWSAGTIRRRQRTMADNILRLDRGEPLLNLV
jgi:phosphoglycerate dehydrogenase-like enzyme